jgi:hypothetical protein
VPGPARISIEFITMRTELRLDVSLRWRSFFSSVVRKWRAHFPRLQFYHQDARDAEAPDRTSARERSLIIAPDPLPSHHCVLVNDIDLFHCECCAAQKFFSGQVYGHSAAHPKPLYGGKLVSSARSAL